MSDANTSGRRSTARPGAGLFAATPAAVTRAEADMAEEHTKTRKERRLAGFWTGVRSVVAIQSSHHVNHKRLLMHDPQHDNHHHGKGRTSVALANKKALTELQLFHPNGGWKMAWEFVSALAVLYTMLEVPFRIAFVGDVPMHTPLLTLEALVISIFLLDVVLEFNTAYVDTLTNRLVVDRRRIAWRYAFLPPRYPLGGKNSSRPSPTHSTY